MTAPAADVEFLAPLASLKILRRLGLHPRSAKITAMFQRSLYVTLADGFLIHIGGAELPLSPRSILLRPPDFEQLGRAGCRVGDLAKAEPDALTLGCVRICLRPNATRFFDPKLAPPYPVHSPRVIVNRLTATMRQVSRRFGGRLSPFRGYTVNRFCSGCESERQTKAAVNDAHACNMPPWHTAVRSAADRFLDALAGNDEDEMRSAVCGLIGLGPGLTPSGDDFLAGFMSGLAAMGRSVPAAARCGELVQGAVREQAPGKTTAVSLAMLEDALQGEVAEPVADFLRTLVQPDDAVEARVLAQAHSFAATICSVGESSGEDFLNGLAAGIFHITSERIP